MGEKRRRNASSSAAVFIKREPPTELNDEVSHLEKRGTKLTFCLGRYKNS
jgi:hypothetical protein